ncbi:hypothetical protein SAMN06273572_101803 [Monaibacterium marinum]|uniref:Uncharacterized protein n=1 Tax=Pontivivens marinum TaxID=1690039 RepID=A0A2C9CNZ5_9RHOB|nr:hypothetical protein SAMN06273572_101803 [Monaibacterium marinum]
MNIIPIAAGFSTNQMAAIGLLSGCSMAGRIKFFVEGPL